MTRESSQRFRRGSYARPLLELLEVRLVFASDFGDAPLPYKTVLAEGGAEHVAIGPTLGVSRDTEADGLHSPGADGDDNTGVPDDESGVTFNSVRTGALGATANVTVVGGPARLDGWIDFNGDGSWGGPLEQIADGRLLATGKHTISFDVPSWATDGARYARFRLATAGDLGVGDVAADGEVEDYTVTIKMPRRACGCFAGQAVLSNAANAALDVYAADVDGDGDTDVLSASLNDNKIAWYENDGTENFTTRLISTTAGGAQSVFAVDLDGDSDTDVLSASINDDRIAWYENDGNKNFTTHTISTDGNGPRSVLVADVDGDGDRDVLSALFHDDKIAWYENDGNQNFIVRVISTTADGAFGVYAADVDSDGDLDVLSASRDDDKIAWYENDGNQNFTVRVISTVADRAYSVFATDVDGDGDTDVLSASLYDHKVAWYENDGSENFSERIITITAFEASSVFAADVDGDGDIDVLSASFFDDKVAWYENDGNENFTARTISTAGNGASRVFAADVDSDGDLDVLAASFLDDEIAWYENQRFKKTGVQPDDAPDPSITTTPIPPPPAPIAPFRTITSAEPSRARKESSSGVSGQPIADRLLRCAAYAAPTARHYMRLVSADAVSLEAFFSEVTLDGELS